MSNLEDYWKEFQTKNKLDENLRYKNAWRMGPTKERANELLNQILEGKKTTTSGLLKVFELVNYDIPQIGDYYIILDGEDQPGCIIEMIDVKKIPYIEVTDLEFINGEGEEFNSVEKWREVHKDFFEKGLKNWNIEFEEQMLVLCLYFKIAYK